MKTLVFGFAAVFLVGVSSYMLPLDDDPSVTSFLIVSSTSGKIRENEFLVFQVVNDTILWNAFGPDGTSLGRGNSNLSKKQLLSILRNVVNHRERRGIGGEVSSPLFSLLITKSDGTAISIPSLTEAERQLLFECVEMRETVADLKKHIVGKRYALPKLWAERGTITSTSPGNTEGQSQLPTSKKFRANKQDRPREEKKPMSEAERGAATEQTSKD